MGAMPNKGSFDCFGKVLPLKEPLSQKVLHLTIHAVIISFSLLDVRAGRYHVIVHYYQPNHPSYEITSRISGSGLYAKLRLAHCPNVNGCRQKFTNGQNTFVFDEGNSTIVFDVPYYKDAWIVSLTY